MAVKKDNPHAGHRERMRREFLDSGEGAGMADHRLLELILFYSIPRGDVNLLAHELVKKFGSLSGVFHADYDQLMSVPGMGPSTAVLLRLFPAALSRYREQTESFDGQVVSLRQLEYLLEPYFFGQRDEVACLVCMDGKSKVLNICELGHGVVDTVQIAARKVLEAALACNASQVVLAHNHVSGVACPSEADVATSLHLKRLLAETGITLIDHLILAGGDMVSMAQSGLLSGGK